MALLRREPSNASVVLHQIPTDVPTLTPATAMFVIGGTLVRPQKSVTHIDDEATTFAEALAREHANILLVAKELERWDKQSKQ